ncbi:hypothetical protein [Methanococcoides seepicolus]|uniref:Uncharacterized protein n=1 Tax=Methanococcoides seepicolus TaxID=2828780 RepID=A0A9E5DBV4_9EURY|nr:hypothetical protein [Methanococcoides seepicolus]MCM1986818.1 hypothetical protein [Methanococcoides seepicolus]
MKKFEINQLIQKKVNDSDESDIMKNFILEILDLERRNVEYPQNKYVKDFTTMAGDYSNKEQRG